MYTELKEDIAVSFFNLSRKPDYSHSLFVKTMTMANFFRYLRQTYPQRQLTNKECIEIFDRLNKDYPHTGRQILECRVILSESWCWSSDLLAADFLPYCHSEESGMASIVADSKIERLQIEAQNDMTLFATAREYVMVTPADRRRGENIMRTFGWWKGLKSAEPEDIIMIDRVTLSLTELFMIRRFYEDSLFRSAGLWDYNSSNAAWTTILKANSTDKLYHHSRLYYSSTTKSGGNTGVVLVGNYDPIKDAVRKEEEKTTLTELYSDIFGSDDEDGPVAVNKVMAAAAPIDTCPLYLELHDGKNHPPLREHYECALQLMYEHTGKYYIDTGHLEHHLLCKDDLDCGNINCASWDLLNCGTEIKQTKPNSTITPNQEYDLFKRLSSLHSTVKCIFDGESEDPVNQPTLATIRLREDAVDEQTPLPPIKPIDATYCNQYNQSVVRDLLLSWHITLVQCRGLDETLKELESMEETQKTTPDKKA